MMNIIGMLLIILLYLLVLIIGTLLIIMLIVLILKLLDEWWEYGNNSNNTIDTSDLLVSVLYLWHDKRKIRRRNKRWLETQMKAKEMFEKFGFERQEIWVAEVLTI